MDTSRGSGASPSLWEAILLSVLRKGSPYDRRPSTLSQRELQVASLIAKGLTNRGIAVVLEISERTAANHVHHIFNKLGFSSRAQIAAWAVAQGLVSVSRE